jgi:hypothetical protein
MTKKLIVKTSISELNKIKNKKFLQFQFKLSLVCHFLKMRRHEKKPSTNTNNVKTKATQKKPILFG